MLSWDKRKLFQINSCRLRNNLSNLLRYFCNQRNCIKLSSYHVGEFNTIDVPLIAFCNEGTGLSLNTKRTQQCIAPFSRTRLPLTRVLNFISRKNLEWILLLLFIVAVTFLKRNIMENIVHRVSTFIEDFQFKICDVT